MFGQLLPLEFMLLVGGVEHLEFAHVLHFGPDALDVHDFGSRRQFDLLFFEFANDTWF